jgi:hypothetical protein
VWFDTVAFGKARCDGVSTATSGAPLCCGFCGVNCPPDVLVMHPGPINRGVELASEVADGPNSTILGQVTNGLAIRMAVLFLLNQVASSEA